MDSCRGCISMVVLVAGRLGVAETAPTQLLVELLSLVTNVYYELEIKLNDCLIPLRSFEADFLIYT